MEPHPLSPNDQQQEQEEQERETEEREREPEPEPEEHQGELKLKETLHNKSYFDLKAHSDLILNQQSDSSNLSTTKKLAAAVPTTTTGSLSTTATTTTQTQTPARIRLIRDVTLKQHAETKPTPVSRTSSYHTSTISAAKQKLTVSLSNHPHLIPTKSKLLLELENISNQQAPREQQADHQNNLNSLMLSLIRELSSRLNQSQNDLRTSQLQLNGLKDLLTNTYSVGPGEIERCLVRARVPNEPQDSILNQSQVMPPPWHLELNNYSVDHLSTPANSLPFSSSLGPSCSSTQLDLDDLREAMFDNPCFDTTASSSSCRSRSRLTSPVSLTGHILESPLPPTIPQAIRRNHPHPSASKLFNSAAILTGKYRKSAPIPPVQPAPSSSSDHHHHHHDHNHSIEELAAVPGPSTSSSTPHKRTASIGRSFSGVSSGPGTRLPPNNVWGLYGWKWNKRNKANGSFTNVETGVDGRVNGEECVSPEEELGGQRLENTPPGAPASLDGDIDSQLKQGIEPVAYRSRTKRSPTEASSSTILSGLFDSLTRRKRTESNQSHLQKPSVQSFNSRATATGSCVEPSPGSVNVSSSLVTRSPSLTLNSSSSINTQTTSTSSSCSVNDPNPHPQIHHPLTNTSQHVDLTPSLPGLVRADSGGHHSSSESLDPSSSISNRPAGSQSVTKFVRNPMISDSSAANRRPSLINLKSPAESFVSTSKGLPTLATHADMMVHSEMFQLPPALSGLSADNAKDQSITEQSNNQYHSHVNPDGDSSSFSQSVSSSVTGPATFSTEINERNSSRLRSPPSHQNLSIRSSKSSVVASASQRKSKPQVKLTQSATTKSYLSTATGTIGKALGANPSSSEAAVPAEFEPNVTTVPNAAFGRLASVYFRAPDSRSSRSSNKARSASILSAGQAAHKRLVANMIPGTDYGADGSSIKHPAISSIPTEPITHHGINKLNLKFLPPLSNTTMELSTFISPQSNPPPFSNFGRDDDARGLDVRSGPSSGAADDEPIIDRFGFIVDVKYGLKLMRKSRDKQKQLAKERLAALEQQSHHPIPSQPHTLSSPGDSTVILELPIDPAPPSENPPPTLNSPSSPAPPLPLSEENSKFNPNQCDASVEGSDLDHTPMMTTALPIKSQVDVEAELSSLREALGLSPAIKAGNKHLEGSTTDSVENDPGSSSSSRDPVVESSTQSIRRLLFQLNEMQNMLEKKQMEAWGQFITKRRTKLMRVTNSTTPVNLVAASSSSSTSDPPGAKTSIQGTGAVSPASVGAFLGTGLRQGSGSCATAASPTGTMPKTPTSASGQQNSKRQIGESVKVHDLITCHDDNLIGIASMGLSNDNNKKALKDEWKEFKALVIQGIPISLRPKIWLECSGASELKEPGYYHDLLNLHDGEEGLCLNQIECDVTRTLPTNVYFGGDGPGVSKLRRVLAAMSWHNPVVGYCQGMNMVAATLLLTIPSEEDAFWILVCIVDKILPSHYYTSHLLTSQADQRVLKVLVHKYLAELSDHFEALDVDLPAITFGWFLSLFADALPIQTLLRVFDIFLIDGSLLLFQIALALLKINQSTILSYDSPASLYAYMRGPMTLSSHHADRLISVATLDFADIKNSLVVSLRQQFVDQIKLEMGLSD